MAVPSTETTAETTAEATAEAAAEPGRLSRLRGPLLALLLVATPALVWDDLIAGFGGNVIDSTVLVLRYTVSTALWLVLAWLTVRLIDVIVWRGIVGPRLGGKVPRLLKDVVAAIVFLIALSGILGVVFDLDVTGLWATSGVVGLVVGLAMQSMIADVFSGIALNIDRPFKIGDWVRIHYRGREQLIGEVIETNWRSTRLRTVDGLMLVVPNGQIATMVVANLTSPLERSRFSLYFCLDFGVPTSRALRILEAGVRSAEGVLAKPAPKVRVNSSTRYGVEYEVRYWLVPRETSPSKGRHRVGKAVLQHLHSAGLTLAYEKHDVFTAEMPQRQLDTRSDCGAIVHRVDLFQDLDEDELASLCASLDAQQLPRGANVVAAGDSGDSMYIVVEGLLEVFALVDGVELKVGRITPGEFFGEMSLLTGEPRSATVRAATEVVLFEIRKDNLLPLFEARPALATSITEKVAERKLRSERRRREASEQQPSAQETKTLAGQILGKMKRLFRLANGE